MISLIHCLIAIWVVFTITCLGFCLEAHLRYHHKRGIDAEEDFHGRYKYFVQAIYDHDQQPIGYELLLREYDQSRQAWYLPTNIVFFPLSKMIAAIQALMPRLTGRTQLLGLNMTVNQLTDFRAAYFFRWVVGITGSAHEQISIEVDAHELIATNWVQRLVIRRLLAQAPARIKFMIENVDSSRQMYRKLRPFLTHSDYLKFNATAFNKSADHWIDVTLAQWQSRLEAYGVVPIVGKVEEPGQMQLADQLQINYRQGYGYGHPQDLDDLVTTN